MRRLSDKVSLIFRNKPKVLGGTKHPPGVPHGGSSSCGAPPLEQQKASK